MPKILIFTHTPYISITLVTYIMDCKIYFIIHGYIHELAGQLASVAQLWAALQWRKRFSR
jgi:hypothetical protein